MDDAAVDFREIFDSLPEAVAVCDEQGAVVALNERGRRMLGVDDGARLRLRISDRETVREMRVAPAALDQHEFYLADVCIEGAQHEHVSVSLRPLSGGGYRVVFTPSGQGRGMTPNLRILEVLVNAGRHLELFKTPEKVLALFAASFQEVFPDYRFHLELDFAPGWRLDFDHDPVHTAGRQPDVELGPIEGPHVPQGQRLWADSRRAYRIGLRELTEFDGLLQVEKADEERFAVQEREAFETFAQQLAFALARLRHREGLQLVTPILDQLDAVVAICDARRRVLVSNRTFETIIGGDDPVVGRDVLDFFDETSRARIRTSAAAVMAGRQADAFPAARARDAAGGAALTLNVQVSASRRGPDGQATGFILTAQKSDVTLVELEERMSRAEHLMNLGQLATGVAHELKNPLTSILNYADYLLKKYQGSFFEDRDRERLRRIIDGVERIDGFVRDLMTMARPAEASLVEEVDLGPVLHNCASLCEVMLRDAGAELTIELQSEGDEPLQINGVASQLTQVFVNLVTNAARAMPAEGGHVRIEVGREGDQVVSRVIDDAGGMNEATVARVFEPFFTTRAGSGGSGLGLAIVRSIVGHHGGRIDVDSTPGVGTVFTVRLPAA